MINMETTEETQYLMYQRNRLKYPSNNCPSSMTKFLKTYKLKWTSIFVNLKSLPALFSPQHIWNMYAPGVLGTLFSEAHSFGDDFQLN